MLEKSQKENQECVEGIQQEVEAGDSGKRKCGCCHEGKKKKRSETEHKDLIHRLNRIEGQVRGIKRMVDEDAYCPDILIQVSAIQAALNSFNKLLLANHIRSCVADDIRKGNDEVIDELVGTMQKLMK
ncbi:MAG: metal-sensing transcriptional repressor [Lachnospiraceae bacterium]|nr:metal-sensing transcriptional repressor [Lachnospiraceae bacterium]